MRLYSFGNRYITGVQAGVQCQHATVELMNNYPTNAMVHAWATDHQTTILLNGGGSKDMNVIVEFLSRGCNELPWELFYESEEALDGLLTNICIVVPERVYSYGKYYKDDAIDVFAIDNPTGLDHKPLLADNQRSHGDWFEYTEWEIELANLLSSKRLMN